MTRLLLLCHYFDKFHGRRGGTLQFYDAWVPWHEFINHLLNEKHFGEDVRETLKRKIHRITGYWILQGGKDGLYRMQKSKRMVYDLIENAVAQGSLIERKNRLSFSNGELKMTDYGRRFMQPLNFIEACAQEYGALKSFLFGVGGTLLMVFWNKILATLGYLLS